ncbi:SAM-dependent DNA methyltransferase [Myxococcota bacterium]|nr:SAM-dependent DNA methyltransferase [Myxococcota bacterium]
MLGVANAESRRLALQDRLDSERSADERNRWGQFATPPALAAEVAKEALRQVGESGPLDFLEPSIGSGTFFSALLSLTGPGRVRSATGIELDERFAQASGGLWEEFGLKVVQGDFTQLRPAPEGGGVANLLIANPPYVRHHHLDRLNKVDLQARAAKILGRPVSGLSGLYVYFMVLADPWLAEGGIGAWLIPSEWMDVNYGAALRWYLTTHVQLLRVHRFDAADVQFGDALVSSSVVFYRKRRVEPGAHLAQLTTGSIERPSRCRLVSALELSASGKWSHFFTKTVRTAPTLDSPSVDLGRVLEVKRGIATGGNRFFIRPRTEFTDLGIPDRFLRPIVPSSRFLTGSVIGRGQDGYPDVPSPLALLDCDLPEERVRTHHPALWSYFESPAGQEVRRGYLTSGRKPWYSQEHRPAAPVLVTYMGRGRSGGNPFRFFWNRSDATATNVYLMLFPRRPLAELLQRDPDAGEAIVEFLADRPAEELLGHGREYGGGLFKLEPKELGRLDVRELLERLGIASLDPPTVRRKRQLSLAFGAGGLAGGPEAAR